MVELLDLKIDVVFKDFFGDKSSQLILEDFINTVLELKGKDRIEIVEFLDPRKMRIEIGRPTTFVDLSVKTKGGERYIIEMQTYNHEGFDKRLLYYLGKDFPKVHVIAIVDFHRSERTKNGILNDKKVVETYRFSPSISSSNNHLFDQWKATLIDLKKFPDKPLSQLKTDKDKWLYLLKSSSLLKEKETSVLRKDPVFGRALARLERLSSDPKTRKAYENSINEQRDNQAILEAALKAGREEGERVNHKKNLEEGKRLGFKKGIEAGRQKEKLEIAKALLKKLLTMQEVAKITGLSLKEIKSLKI